MKRFGEVMLLIITALSLANTGCGVKGDPLPPEKPPELGRGKPSYNRATKGMPYPSLPPIKGEKETEEEETKNEK
ncbi:MAG: hypothetical protein KDD43_00350 [Bdellovibrionales bacterium]|nr:hypothetical protein [Bdellovibrionales bacterium]